MPKILKERILYLAIILSAGMHIFWMSVVTVVVTPKESGRVKFSKISFLGPISEKGMLKVGIEPRERSFLENRYLNIIRKESSFDSSASAVKPYVKNSGGITSERALVGLIAEAVGNSKLAPLFTGD